RRSAKRAAVNKYCKAEYAAAQKTWAEFVAWCRYSVLQFKMPDFGHLSRRKMWREQREQLAVVITAALQNNHYHPLLPDDLKRAVDLLKPSLRRRGMLRELLQNPGPHFEFVIDFLKDRFELVRTPDAPLLPGEAMLRRAEIF